MTTHRKKVKKTTRNLTFLNLLILLAITGCGVTIQRGVHDNTFYSTYPELAIKMASEFEYVDNKESVEDVSTDRSEIGLSAGADCSTEQFIFEDRLTRKGSKITINRLTSNRVFWNPNLTSNLKNSISAGIEKHQGNEYQYAVFPIQTNNNGCFLMKSMGRIVGGSRDTLLEILYFESVGDLPQECRPWKKSKEDFNDSQKKTLAKFLENCDRNVEFISLVDADLN